MKTFEKLNYKRPNFKLYSKKFNFLLELFKNSNTFAEQDKIFQKINKLNSNFNSQKQICEIRYNCNTLDSFYDTENEYFDNIGPKIDAIHDLFNKALLNSNFKNEFSEKYGKQLFLLLEISLKTFSEFILNELQEENRLNSEHTKIIAQAKINYNENIYNLSSIEVFQENSDREIRKKSAFAKTNWYLENKDKLEQLYDDMVHLRHKIALKLGYNNFVELGYDRMYRTYGPKEVANFRELIRKYICPIAANLIERQKRRLNVDKLKFYDESFWFQSGNAMPFGNILEKSSQMFHELSKETGKFYDFMIDKKLLDLDSRDGKSTGGFCDFIEKYKYPFIFCNFTGTSEDIDVFNHEFGHAFQVYCSRNLINAWPTYDVCEIHSMSMEFLLWPWMELFFKNPDKYKFSHLASCILFLPYCVAVDEFQHFVYENPDCSKMERNTAWRKIEEKYMPWIDWDGIKFLENGGNWMVKAHIFTSPFYYIDYGLAQICAFQFWQRDQLNFDISKLRTCKLSDIITTYYQFKNSRKENWNNYLNLCKAGGSKSFMESLELGKLNSPFEENCFVSIIREIENWLNSVNDSQMNFT